MSDPVRELLNRLDDDVSQVRGPDAASVRRRGDQRRRRQGTLAVAGSVLAVVAVVLIPLALHGFPSAHRAPAASSGPSGTPSVPSPSAEERTFTFLTPSQLPGPATGARWRPVDAQPGSAVARCVDPASTGVTGAQERWFATSPNPANGDEIAVERLLTFETPQRASIAFTTLATQAQTCSYDSSESGSTPAVGDESRALSLRVDVGRDNAASMQCLVLVRVGARIAALTVAMDGNGDIPYIDDLQQQVPVQLAGQLNPSTS